MNILRRIERLEGNFSTKITADMWSEWLCAFLAGCYNHTFGDYTELNILERHEKMCEVEKKMQENPSLGECKYVERVKKSKKKLEDVIGRISK